jgi:hypothetical protein
MAERRRYGLAPTPGTEKEWPATRPSAKDTLDRLGLVAFNLSELPTYVSPPIDGPSGSW